MQVIVMYSDYGMWVVPAFLKLWEKYAGTVAYHLVLCGYTPIEYSGPLKVSNHIIGRQKDFPANRWSDSLRRVLIDVADRTFILMLEDYLLPREVDNKGVGYLFDYTADRPYILKADLTRDRLWSGGGNRYLWDFNTYARLGHLELIRSFPGTEYNMSLWGGIWNNATLLRFLVPGESAQQIELNGTHRVNQEGDKVLIVGTRQGPMVHTNVVQGGRLNPHETVGLPALEADDRELVLSLKGIPYTEKAALLW